jgi:uncharacterized protein (UPF0264 family)
MRLLVSAANAADAAAALAGGADYVDAKDPTLGALGAVTLDRFRDIVAAVAGRRAVTAALGDAGSPAAVEAGARAFALAGASMVKVGLDAATSLADAHDRASSAVRAARPGGASVIVVAYADRPRGGVPPDALLDVASAAGAAGVLLDTADKQGPRLLDLMSPAQLAAWTERAHRRSLTVALAGRLRAEDLPLLQLCGADVAGVRGAACHGGRTGAIDAAAVRQLAASLQAAASTLGA